MDIVQKAEKLISQIDKNTFELAHLIEETGSQKEADEIWKDIAGLTLGGPNIANEVWMAVDWKKVRWKQVI